MSDSGSFGSRRKHGPAKMNVNSFTFRAFSLLAFLYLKKASTGSFGAARSLADELAARGRSRRGADDPTPERREIALLGSKTAIDQIPAHALRHRQRKRRDQPSGGEIVVDIGPDAHRNPQPVDGGLQRLAVILQLRSARRHPRDAGGLEPQRPVVRRMRDAQQAWSPEIGGGV